MVFIRTKKIKNKNYAYLVENTWTKQGTRQKVKGYLGRIVEMRDQNPITFQQFMTAHRLEPKHPQDMIHCLVCWELYQHGFVPNGNSWQHEEITVVPSDGTVISRKKPVVLRMNDNFMSTYTLQKLLAFKPEGDERSVAVALAEALVSAGIKIPKDVYIELFEKMQKKSVE